MLSIFYHNKKKVRIKKSEQRLKDRGCICFFSHCSGKVHDTKQLREGRLYHGSQPEGTWSTPWWGRHGNRTVRRLASWHPHSGSRGRWTLVLSSLSPFYSVWDLSPWDGFTYSSRSFYLNIISRKAPLQMPSEVYLPGLERWLSGKEH